MTAGIENFRILLRASGYSITRPRLTVFQALHGREPTGMRELIGKIRGVDRASIYRAVELFERLGIAQRLNSGWKYKLELTDKFNAHHHHLTCLDCGRTIAMNEDELERTITELAAQHRFRPVAHQIEIQGHCVNCQT